jgi:hypothetical protein
MKSMSYEKGIYGPSEYSSLITRRLIDFITPRLSSPKRLLAGAAQQPEEERSAGQGGDDSHRELLGSHQDARQDVRQEQEGRPAQH